MSETIVAALVGALTAIITSILAAWISYRNISKEYKTRYHMDLIAKQIDACEKLWIVLDIASKSKGDQRLINRTDKEVIISTKAAINIYENLNQTFNSPSGLYFSKELRANLFNLRDFLSEEILKDYKEPNLQWSKTKANKLDGYVQNLRNAIRQEIGLDDLRISRLNRPG